MNYKELKDRLTRCEYTLQSLKDGSLKEKDKNTILKLEVLKESLEKQLKEADSNEIEVFGYQTKHFDMCPGATKLFKDILAGEYTDGVPSVPEQDKLIELAKLHDVLFAIEKIALKDSNKAKQHLQKAINIASDIYELGAEIGLDREHRGEDLYYIEDHIKKINDAARGDVNEQEKGTVITNDSEEAEKLARKGVNVNLKTEGPHQTTYIKVPKSDYNKAIGILDSNIDPTYAKMDVVDDDGDGNVIIYFNFRAKDDGEPGEDPAQFLYDVSMDLEANGISIVDKSHDLDEANLNDPVLMKLRALKTKIGRKKGIVKGGERHTAKKRAILSKLQIKKDQVMRDMEQEAEPEGGPIADKYGDMLNKIDAAIAKAKGTKSKSYDDTFNEGQDDIFSLGYDLDATQYVIDYLKFKYKEGQDYELHIGRGDTHPNAITLINPEMEQDKELGNLLMAAGDNEETDYQSGREAENDYIGEKKRPGLWANIRAKRARGEKPAHKNSNAHKDAVKAGKKINKDEGLWANINAKRKAGKKPSHGNSKAHKDAVKAGNKLKEEDVNLSKEHLSIIASKAGKAIVQAVHDSGDEVSSAKIKKVFSSALSPSTPEAFTVHIIYKNDAEISYRFQIEGENLIFLADGEDIILSDVGVKPSGEPFINTELVRNEMTKYFKQMREMNDKEFSDAQEADRLENHPEKDKIIAIQNLIAKEKGIKEEDLDIGHQDDEPSMLKSSAVETATYAAKLAKKLNQYDKLDGEVDFPNWWQKKLILARDYISAAFHYLDSDEKDPLEGDGMSTKFKPSEGDPTNMAYTDKVNEEYTKEKLLAYLGQADDAMIRTNDNKYLIIYNPKNGNQDNYDMWGDYSVFAVDQDGGEHEVLYSDIDDFQLEGIKEDALGFYHIEKLGDKAASHIDIETRRDSRYTFGQRPYQDDQLRYQIAKELGYDVDSLLEENSEMDKIIQGRKLIKDLAPSMNKLPQDDPKRIKFIKKVKQINAKYKELLAKQDNKISGTGRDQELSEGRGDFDDVLKAIENMANNDDISERDAAAEIVLALADKFQLPVDKNLEDYMEEGESDLYEGTDLHIDKDFQFTRTNSGIQITEKYSGYGADARYIHVPGRLLKRFIAGLAKSSKVFKDLKYQGQDAEDALKEAEAKPIPDQIRVGYNQNIKNAQTMASALLSVFDQFQEKENQDFTKHTGIKIILNKLRDISKEEPGTEEPQQEEKNK